MLSDLKQSRLPHIDHCLTSKMLRADFERVLAYEHGSSPFRKARCCERRSHSMLTGLRVQWYEFAGRPKGSSRPDLVLPVSHEKENEEEQKRTCTYLLAEQ